MVAEVAALLPPLVKLEFEGRYAAMLSHEPKNYALQSYEGSLLLRGVAFRSRRAEPFGEAFLKRAHRAACSRTISPGVREAYADTVFALRRRTVPTWSVASHVRLTKSAAEYRAIREQRRELPYEAMLASGRTEWEPGTRVHVYRASGGRAGLVPERDPEDEASVDDSPTRATTTPSTTCGCSATRSRAGSPARSRPRTSRRSSPTPGSRRSSRPRSTDARSVLTVLAAPEVPSTDSGP